MILIFFVLFFCTRKTQDILSRQDSQIVLDMNVPDRGKFVFKEHPPIREGSLNWIVKREYLHSSQKYFLLFGGIGYSPWHQFGYCSDIWWWDMETYVWTIIYYTIDDFYVNITKRNDHPGSRAKSITFTHNDTYYLFGGLGVIFESNDTFPAVVAYNDLWEWKIDEMKSLMEWKELFIDVRPPPRTDAVIVEPIGFDIVFIIGGNYWNVTRKDIWSFNKKTMKFTESIAKLTFSIKHVLCWMSNTTHIHFFGMKTKKLKKLDLMTGEYTMNLTSAFIAYNQDGDLIPDEKRAPKDFENNIYLPFSYKESVYFISFYDSSLYGEILIGYKINMFWSYDVFDNNNTLPHDSYVTFSFNNETVHQFYFWIMKKGKDNTFRSTMYEMNFHFCGDFVNLDLIACSRKLLPNAVCYEDDKCYCGGFFGLNFLPIFSDGESGCINYFNTFDFIVHLTIWIAVLMIGVVTCCFSFYNFFSFSRKNKEFNSLILLNLLKKDEEEDEFEDEVEHISFSKFKDQFKNEKKIGEGTYCDVFKFKLNKEEFAARIFKEDMLDYKQFAGEINLLSKLNHENVIKIEKASVTPPLIGYVTSLCDGNIEELIRIKKFTINEKISKLFQVASGMFYLHSKNILHRDLKWENVLYVKDNCKISDFGFSKKEQIVDVEIIEDAIGTQYFLAPEVFMEKKFVKQSDVYSFGVMIYQIFFDISIDELGDNVSSVENHYYKFKKHSFDRKYKWLMRIKDRCLKKKVKDRPYFEDIVKSIFENAKDIISSNLLETNRKKVNRKKRKMLKKYNRYFLYNILNLVTIFLSYSINFIMLTVNLFFFVVSSNFFHFCITCSEFLYIAMVTNSFFIRFYLKYKTLRKEDLRMNVYLSSVNSGFCFVAILFWYLTDTSQLDSHSSGVTIGVITQSLITMSFISSSCVLTHDVVIYYTMKEHQSFVSNNIENEKKRYFFLIALLLFLLLVEYLLFHFTFDYYFFTFFIHYMFRFVFYVFVIGIVILYNGKDNEKREINRKFWEKAKLKYSFLKSVEKYGVKVLFVLCSIICVVYLCSFHSFSNYAIIIYNWYVPIETFWGILTFYEVEQLLYICFVISCVIMFLIYYLKKRKEKERILVLKDDVKLLNIIVIVIGGFITISFINYIIATTLDTVFRFTSIFTKKN